MDTKPSFPGVHKYIGSVHACYKCGPNRMPPCRCGYHLRFSLNDFDTPFTAQLAWRIGHWGSTKITTNHRLEFIDQWTLSLYAQVFQQQKMSWMFEVWHSIPIRCMSELESDGCEASVRLRLATEDFHAALPSGCAAIKARCGEDDWLVGFLPQGWRYLGAGQFLRFLRTNAWPVCRVCWLSRNWHRKLSGTIQRFHTAFLQIRHMPWDLTQVTSGNFHVMSF